MELTAFEKWEAKLLGGGTKVVTDGSSGPAQSTKRCGRVLVRPSAQGMHIVKVQPRMVLPEVFRA